MIVVQFYVPVQFCYIPFSMLSLQALLDLVRIGLSYCFSLGQTVILYFVLHTQFLSCFGIPIGFYTFPALVSFFVNNYECLNSYLNSLNFMSFGLNYLVLTPGGIHGLSE